MKTVKIRFGISYASQVGILLHSLELKILMNWSEEGFMSDSMIICILRLNNEGSAITPELQMEKLKEKSFIKFI